MFTNAEKLEEFKFQYSKISSGNKFRNTAIDKLPALSYRFGLEGNWKATDKRVASKLDKVYEWFDTYWKLNSKETNKNNKSLYEQELEKAILSAYDSVNERWTKKLEAELEIEFAEDLHKFLMSKKVD